MKINVISSELDVTLIGTSFHIIKELGRGAQGVVFEVVDGRENHQALKVCAYGNVHLSPAKESIIRLAKAGSPSSAFLWPTDWITCNNEDSSKTFHGYLMPLIPSDFKPCYEILRDEIDISISDCIRACIQIAEAFESLHLNGLCYRDISLGNIFINSNGECLVVDVDNISYHEQGLNKVLGTPAFMAPETVMEKTPASAYTDLFSMGVLLFYLLYRGHPLEGQREATLSILDEKAKDDLYGSKAVYIFNKLDDSNRPTEDFHSQVILMHGILPDIINETFHDAFTVGLFKPERRLVAADWCSAFRSSLERMSVCTNCNAEVFREKCWNCGASIANTSRSTSEACATQSPSNHNVIIDETSLWARTKNLFLQSHSKYFFVSWIEPLELVSESQVALTLRAEDDFHFHQIKRLYYYLIKSYAQQVAGAPVAFELLGPNNKVFESIWDSEKERIRVGSYGESILW